MRRPIPAPATGAGTPLTGDMGELFAVQFGCSCCSPEGVVASLVKRVSAGRATRRLRRTVVREDFPGARVLWWSPARGEVRLVVFVAVDPESSVVPVSL